MMAGLGVLSPVVARAIRRAGARRPRLTLLSRFTLVAAGAVAVTALAITTVAYLTLRNDLENQLHADLVNRAAAVKHQARQFHGHVPYGWVPERDTRFGNSTPYTQVITSVGTVWTRPSRNLGFLIPDANAVAVAAGSRPAYYQDTRVDGVRAAVLTTPLDPSEGLALQIAEPLGTTDAEVATVGAVLGVLSLIGVALAALLGLAVARTGLAPVARLAAVAEQVTATGDPDRHVEIGRGDELGRLAASFNRMLRALRHSLASQRQLISDASHELRTPLASLRVNVELLADDPGMSPEERKEVLGRVVAQVTELGDLVSDVTQLARGQHPEESPRSVRMDEVTSAALEAARRDWPNTEFQVSVDGCTVAGSAERLRVAVKNLLDNAAKFGPPGGPVEVRLRGGELTVRDHGPGIAPEDAPHVFDRFYRALSARSVPGSGLGLSLVSDVARSHGGTVEALPALGGGTLMRLTLPTY
ncbi:MAG: HAMP domain-containing histidine kinase [Nocardiopsaceae bacterium]|nr:HAMP domain-containing histidine kinase [Nocardiopsaceae bacterium]